MYSSIALLAILQIISYSSSSEAAESNNNLSSIANCAAVEQSGVYNLNIPGHNETFQVYCDQETDNGGWTLVLNRFKGKLDFHDREWIEYKNGFGRIDREYFIGLEILHLLTTSRTHSLIILMKDFDDLDYSTTVVEFEIDNENNDYEFGYVKKFYGTEVGFPEYSTRFCSIDDAMWRREVAGWNFNGLNSKVTKNRLNLFGPYLKVGGSIGNYTLGFFNEDTKKVHPLRSIKMLMRPVNVFRSAYGETLSKIYSN